jgi:hypothetical protein
VFIQTAAGFVAQLQRLFASYSKKERKIPVSKPQLFY